MHSGYQEMRLRIPVCREALVIGDEIHPIDVANACSGLGLRVDDIVALQHDVLDDRMDHVVYAACFFGCRRARELTGHLRH